MTDGPGPSARQPDPRQSHAVLIGASTYERLESLPAVEKNLEALRGLLMDDSIWGLPEAHCEVLHDPASPTDVIRAVHRAASAADDALLVYFAGHGLPDGEADLHLALPSADDEHLHEAVRYDALRSVIVNAARRCHGKVVILDCCYSGRALTGVMSADATRIADQARIDGTYLMTATAENRLALAPVGAEHTVFTGSLIDKLSHGIPGAPDLLDMETLFYHVRADLAARGLPVPQQRSRNDGKAIALARNRHKTAPAPAPPPAPPPLPPPISPELEPLVMGKPKDVCETVGGLEESRRPAFFGALVARRSHQQVATIIGMLPEATDLLSAVARLAPADVAAIHHTLTLIGLPDRARQLLDVAAEDRPADVAELARALRHDTSYLLDAAAKRAKGRAEIVALVSALWLVGLVDDVDRMLERMAPRLPPHAVARLADDMRAAGHERIAYLLYAAVPDSMSGRPPGELAQLIGAMRDAGHDEWARTVVRALLGTFTTPVGISALHANDLDDVVDLVVQRAASTLDLAGIIGLGEQLHAERLEDVSLRLCLRAALTRPDLGPALVAALREDGRPLDARQVVEVLAKGAPIGRLGAVLDALGPADARILLSVLGAELDRDAARLRAALAAATTGESCLVLLTAAGVSDSLLDTFVRRGEPGAVPLAMKELPSPAARRLLFVAMSSNAFHGIFEALERAGDFDLQLRRAVWQGQPNFEKAQRLLVLLTELRRRGHWQEAQRILAAVMEPCDTRFLDELSFTLDGDSLAQVEDYLSMRNGPEPRPRRRRSQ